MYQGKITIQSHIVTTIDLSIDFVFVTDCKHGSAFFITKIEDSNFYYKIMANVKKELFEWGNIVQYPLTKFSKN